MMLDDAADDDVYVAPFDPGAGIRFKCGHTYRDRDHQLAAFEKSIGFSLPTDFVQMIGDYCEGSFGGCYRVFCRDDVEIQWNHLLLMRVAEAHEFFGQYDSLSLLREMRHMFTDDRGVALFPFGEACELHGRSKMAKGYLAFGTGRKNSVVYVPIGKGKRVDIANSFRDMMLGSYFVSCG